MQTVKLTKCWYRNKEYDNLVAYEVRAPKKGANSWFVTVQNEDISEKPFRAKINGPEDVIYLNGEKPISQKTEEVEETDEQIIERLRENFEIYNDMIDGLANDKIRALIVSGAPGIGKTETIKKRLEEKGMYEETDYSVHRGNITSAFQLYQILYENQMSGKLVILDDCDHILKDSTALNILKAALESGTRKRKVSYKSKTLEDAGTPTEFVYKGSCVFVTNEDFHKHVEKDRGNYSKHLAALIDRSLYLDLMLRSSREVYCRIKQMIMEEGMLDDHPISSDYYETIMNWIYENKDDIYSLSLRAPRHLADIMITSPDKWEKTARVIMTKGKKYG